MKGNPYWPAQVSTTAQSKGKVPWAPWWCSWAWPFPRMGGCSPSHSTSSPPAWLSLLPLECWTPQAEFPEWCWQSKRAGSRPGGNPVGSFRAQAPQSQHGRHMEGSIFCSIPLSSLDHPARWGSAFAEMGWGRTSER